MEVGFGGGIRVWHEDVGDYPFGRDELAIAARVKRKLPVENPSREKIAF